jgi:hypothetical protein
MAMGKAMRCRRGKSTWTLSHCAWKSETVGDGLERLTDCIEMAQAFLETKVAEVV